MFQLLIEEVIPPVGAEDGAFVLLFQGQQEGQQVVIGAQGVLVATRGPVIVQLPDWCPWYEKEAVELGGGICKWSVRPAQEPYTILWPEHVPLANYRLGDLPLRLYFGQEPPALLRTLQALNEIA